MECSDEAYNDQIRPFLLSTNRYEYNMIDNRWRSLLIYSSKELQRYPVSSEADQALQTYLEQPESQRNYDELEGLLPVIQNWLALQRIRFDIERGLGPVNRLRSLLMAQRGVAFAHYQVEQGMQKPEIAIACGAAHTDIADALEMQPDQRLDLIMKDPLLEKILNLGALADIHYAQYQGDGRYLTGKIIDPAFA